MDCSFVGPYNIQDRNMSRFVLGPLNFGNSHLRMGSVSGGLMVGLFLQKAPDETSRQSCRSPQQALLLSLRFRVWSLGLEVWVNGNDIYTLEKCWGRWAAPHTFIKEHVGI